MHVQINAHNTTLMRIWISYCFSAPVLKQLHCSVSLILFFFCSPHFSPTAPAHIPDRVRALLHAYPESSTGHGSAGLELKDTLIRSQVLCRKDEESSSNSMHTTQYLTLSHLKLSQVDFPNSKL